MANQTAEMKGPQVPLQHRLDPRMMNDKLTGLRKIPKGWKNERYLQAGGTVGKVTVSKITYFILTGEIQNGSLQIKQVVS